MFCRKKSIKQPEGCEVSLMLYLGRSLKQGDHFFWKVMEFSKTIFQAWKSWKTAKVMKSHGKG